MEKFLVVVGKPNLETTHRLRVDQYNTNLHVSDLLREITCHNVNIERDYTDQSRDLSDIRGGRIYSF